VPGAPLTALLDDAVNFSVMGSVLARPTTHKPRAGCEVNFIDTANVYSRGRAETSGQSIKTSAFSAKATQLPQQYKTYRRHGPNL
jgi:hypothetical protein